MTVAEIRIRRDIATNWITNNPTLAPGELGLATDTHTLKVGDGLTPWTSLPALTSGASVTPEYVDDAIIAHALDPEPHTAYDDGPSLVLLFENGMA